MNSMEHKEVGDRQLDAVLERLDRLCAEMHSLNRHLDTSEHLLRISRELSTLNESLQALAYAALGQQAPTVRPRRTGYAASLKMRPFSVAKYSSPEASSPKDVSEATRNGSRRTSTARPFSMRRLQTEPEQ